MPRSLDRFLSTVNGIKVSFWGSGTLKIVIPVENHLRNRKRKLADYPPSGMGAVNKRTNVRFLTIYVRKGVVNSGRHAVMLPIGAPQTSEKGVIILCIKKKRETERARARQRWYDAGRRGGEGL